MTRRLRQQLARTQALITTWDSPHFSNDLLRSAPQLRIIAHCGGEVKSRFGPDLLKRLTVITAPEPMARATAELGAALLLYCGRNIDNYRSELMRGDPVYENVHLHGTPEFLIGREIGMIGFGRIGKTIVDLLRGFGFQWRVHDPYSPRTLTQTYPIKFVGLQSLLKRSSIVVLTAALTEETKGMLDRRNLARLPDGATVINIARGGLVDMEALTEEVTKKRLRCAIDVTDPIEPLPARHPLRKLEGAIVTPHMGGGTVKARHEMAAELINDLERFFHGTPVKNRVTTAMLARMT